MSDIAEPDASTTSKSRRKGPLVAVFLVIVFLSAGLASTYTGLWSPKQLLKRSDKVAVIEDAIVFVDVPTIVLMVPGYQGRNVVLSVKLETTSKHQADVEHMIPRVLDAFNDFLAGIDATAYGKRGILDVIRGELVTRADYIIGSEMLKDVLIMEFRIQ